MTRPVEGLTIRAALALGFGLTVGLWLFEGYRFARQMEEVRQTSAAINERYAHAQELLSAVRTQVVLGSVHVRDALLDTDPDSTEGYRRQILTTYETADNQLQTYVPVLNPSEERPRVDALRESIAAFKATMLDVLSTDRRRWLVDARSMLNQRVLPKLGAVITLTDVAQDRTRTAFVRQQADIAGRFGTTQGRVWAQLGLALSGSLGIALLATLYAGRLEQRLRREKAKDVQNTLDLHRLSGQLITAQEEERRTIARELHDEVGQVLMAIKVELSIAQRRAEAAGAPAHLLESAQTITDGAIHTVRDLSHILHPAMLDDLGLPAALDRYLRGFAQRYGIRAELLHDRMDERLDFATETAVYRIVQEALTNVAKHAHAPTCRVRLTRLAQTVVVTIEDDGSGFDATEVPGSSLRRGLGLIGIRERVSQLRGTLLLDSAPGRGTRVTVEFPALPPVTSHSIPEGASAVPFAAPSVESVGG